MSGKGKFFKIKGNICNFPIEAENICNILLRPAVSNGLIVIKLKRDFKYSLIYILNLFVRTLYTRHLLISNLIINFMKMYLLQRISQMRTCLIFLTLLKFKDNLSVTERNVSDEKEMTENTNDRSETEFTSVEDPLNMHRTASNKTTLVFQIPNIINEENVIIAPGQGKTPVSILNDEFCEGHSISISSS